MKDWLPEILRERVCVFKNWALVFFIESKNGAQINPTRLPLEPKAWLVVLFSVINWAGKAQSNDQSNKMGKL